MVLLRVGDILMGRHIYIFAGFPGKDRVASGGLVLNAAGLRHCIEDVEELGLLEYDPSIQVRKEGVFVVTARGEEQLSDQRICLSDMVIQAGITEDWLDDNFTIGNGVNCPKTVASYKTRLVNHQCGRTQDEILHQDGVLDMSQLRLRQVHDFSEGWARYERRWRSGTCPRQNHIVHLTTMVFVHELQPSAYDRIMAIVEHGADPTASVTYHRDYFSTSRTYMGTPHYIRS